tara:strand:+ start:224 stop:784 length:561 start_codon:yes stop_codon:yes gene_type:complete
MSIKHKQRFNWSNVSNGISITRILIGFPLVLTLANRNYIISILIIIIGAITDYLDGFIARKFNCKSSFGAKIDPLADKIFLLGPLIWIAYENYVPIWSIWILISRELIITGWRSNISSGAPASIYGKYKTVLLFLSIILLIWPQSLSYKYDILINRIGYFAFWVSFILAISSGIKYLIIQRENHRN